MAILSQTLFTKLQSCQNEQHNLSTVKTWSCLQPCFLTDLVYISILGTNLVSCLLNTGRFIPSTTYSQVLVFVVGTTMMGTNRAAGNESSWERNN